MFFLKLF